MLGSGSSSGVCVVPMNIRFAVMAAILALCAALSGCGIKYAKNMPGMYVYPDTGNHIDIQVVGNGLSMSQTTANDYAMLRAADAALDGGYRYFEVLRGTGIAPITTRTVGGSEGNATAVAAGGMLYVTGSTANTYNRAYAAYGAVTVYLFNEPRKNARIERCYDAAKVRDELGRKYRT